jgi:hypothetical protein
MKNLLSTLQRIRDSWFEELTFESALALDAFLCGYSWANGALGEVLRSATNQLEGPSGASLCKRAFLLERDPRRTLHLALDHLESSLRSQEPEPSETPYTRTSVVELIREPVRAGRTGLVMGEPTIEWLANYARGRFAGLEAIDPRRAEAERRDVDAFEQWMRARFAAVAPWHGILRAYYNMDLGALQKLIEFWDEFIESRGTRAEPDRV